CNWKLKTEASGNMTPDTAAVMAEAGVDFVSAGALTHSASWLDFSLYMRPLESE
ncbi:MAG: nicotinate-nucleotide diphosphorylase (carboxylating), partial [Deltaproteobacteria bacterium]|nr:nicotinate-nucleotide diphosphorylase (carboxylating) [Deltaproteobacteria bacterium]